MYIEFGGCVNRECSNSHITSGIGERFAPNNGSHCIISPLHLAVRVCYDDLCKSQSIGVLERLLEAGADPYFKMNACYVCRIKGTAEIVKSFPGGNALTFADYLAQHRLDYALNCCMMNNVKQLLRAKMIALKKRKASVLLSTQTYWPTILHDSDFYDISFKCSDREIVHAHKPILATASAYFRTMFLGSWKEMTDNVIELKETSSTTMKILLKYIYTGSLDIDSTKLEEEIMLLFPLAYQYMITPLQEICEHQCTEMLDHAHIVDIMQLARLHSATKLQLSCFEYVKTQAASLMVQPGFMALATADPELWSDLTKYITGTDSTTTPGTISTTSSGSAEEAGTTVP